MAIILEQKACPDEAISSFQKAIQIKPDIYKTYNKLPYRAVILRHGYHPVYCTPSDFLNWSLTSLEEYEKLAVQLASRSSELKAVRHKLNINRQKKPLFDTARFVRNLEHTYSEMWRIFLEGRAPTQIEVFEV